MTSKRWLSTGTAANLLGISVERVRRLARRGVLTFRQFGKGLALEVDATQVRVLAMAAGRDVQASSTSKHRRR